MQKKYTHDNGSEQNVKCGVCGKPLAHPHGLAKEARIPCPICGNTSRKFTAILPERVKMSDHMSYLQEQKGLAIGFGESPRNGRSTFATLETDTELLKFSVSGSSPQGEEDTLHACHVLALRLRQEDAAWHEPTLANGQFDCFIPHSDKRLTLKVQVVRAVVDQDLWRTLNVIGTVSRNVLITEAACSLKAAVELKASIWKIPATDRHAVTLALDATRLPGIVFDAVVKQFRAKHGAWVNTLGFAAVWLVGPTPRLVWRLDEPVGS